LKNVSSDVGLVFESKRCAALSFSQVLELLVVFFEIDDYGLQLQCSMPSFPFEAPMWLIVILFAVSFIFIYGRNAADFID